MANTEVIKPLSTSRTCTTAGTAVRAAATNAHADRYCDTAVIQANSANTGRLFVGGSDVSSSNGFILSPGDAVNLGQFIDKKRGAVLDLYNFFVVSESNNDNFRVLRSKQVAESEL